MATRGFGSSFAEAFSRNLPVGVQAGIQGQQMKATEAFRKQQAEFQQKRLDLQERAANLEAYSTLNKGLDQLPPDSAARQEFLNGWFAQANIDPKSSFGKAISNMAKSKNEFDQKMLKGLSTFAIKAGVSPEAALKAFQRAPGAIMKAMLDAQTAEKENARDTALLNSGFGGLVQGDQGQPATQLPAAAGTPATGQPTAPVGGTRPIPSPVQKGSPLSLMQQSDRSLRASAGARSTGARSALSNRASMLQKQALGMMTEDQRNASQRLFGRLPGNASEMEQVFGLSREEGISEKVEVAGRSAKAKETAKEQAFLGKRLNPAIANLAGVGNNLTHRQAIELGIPTERDIKPTELSKLNKQRRELNRAVNIGRTLMGQVITQGPQILGATGAVARTFKELASIGNNIAILAGKEPGMLRDPANYEAAFKDIGLTGIENAIMRSRVLDLAFGLAAAAEGNRLSDADVERRIRILGGNLNNPEAFLRIMAEQMALADQTWITTLEGFGFKNPTSMLK